LFECGEFLDKFNSDGIVCGVLEDDVVLYMVVCSGLACGVWDSSIGACSDITSPRAETVQIVSIKIMGDSKVEKGRCDEFVSYGYGTLDA
jgi:hypothetical protein